MLHRCEVRAAEFTAEAIAAQWADVLFQRVQRQLQAPQLAADVIPASAQSPSAASEVGEPPAPRAEHQHYACACQYEKSESDDDTESESFEFTIV